MKPITNAVIAACMFVLVGAIGGALVTVALVPATVHIVNEQQDIQDIIDEQTDAIMASQEYQNEMQALAKARALYILSNERQDIAIELADMALDSYNKNQELGAKWFNQ
jgi:hypothetical protein